ATTRSLASASLNPPPNARPLTAAMIGLLMSKRAVNPPNRRQLNWHSGILGLVLEVVAGRECPRAGTGQARDPQTVVGVEVMRDSMQLPMELRVKGVHNLRPVDHDVSKIIALSYFMN